MSFMFTHSYVYDNWVKVDVIGEMCSIQDKSENCMEDFSGKAERKRLLGRCMGYIRGSC
jgi:hypothetical protein